MTTSLYHKLITQQNSNTTCKLTSQKNCHIMFKFSHKRKGIIKMNKENILGTEKITKLIKRFSIPCIISMLVNSLYNMVDQIFIGHGVGMLGNGATNVVFPISVIALAVSLMFGDGSSAFLSLKLGEKKEDEAATGVGTGILLSIIISIIFTLITYRVYSSFLG